MESHTRVCGHGVLWPHQTPSTELCAQWALEGHSRQCLLASPKKGSLGFVSVPEAPSEGLVIDYIDRYRLYRVPGGEQLSEHLVGLSLDRTWQKMPPPRRKSPSTKRKAVNKPSQDLT